MAIEALVCAFVKIIESWLKYDEIPVGHWQIAKVSHVYTADFVALCNYVLKLRSQFSDVR